MLDSFELERNYIISFLGRRQAEMIVSDRPLEPQWLKCTRMSNDIVKVVILIEKKKNKLFSCRRYSTSYTLSQGHLLDYSALIFFITDNAGKLSLPSYHLYFISVYSH